MKRFAEGQSSLAGAANLCSVSCRSELIVWGRQYISVNAASGRARGQQPNQMTDNCLLPNAQELGAGCLQIFS